MGHSEWDVLERAHRLFAPGTSPASPEAWPADADPNSAPDPDPAAVGRGGDRYRVAAHVQRETLRSTRETDAAVRTVLAAAHADHTEARHRTARVLDDARADVAAPATPLAYREALRRRAARLRAQHAHVLLARRRARRHRMALRRLHYRRPRHRGAGSTAAVSPNTRAGRAVRAALSRLGRPYVWGATGPDRFDCSGLTQWAYAQAGMGLDRTTYQQINAGIPVPLSQIRPGDLVFPTVEHVQLAIGNNLVVEAPHRGAAVRVSPLGAHIAIRRPLP